MFFKVDISLESSYFIFPKRGEYYEECPALIANLGSVFFQSKEGTQDPATVVKTMSEEEKIFSSKVSKLKVDFSVKCVLLEVKEREKPMFR